MELVETPWTMVDFKKALLKKKVEAELGEFQGIKILGIDMAAGPDQSMIVNDVDAKFVGPLMKAWEQTWAQLDKADVKKWGLAYDVATISYIIAAEMKNGDINNVQCTKDYLEDQLSEFEKPNPPKWSQMDTAFCEKTCEGFLMEAFGTSKHNKPILSIVSNKGKVMLCNYAGTCPGCGVNFAKQTVIIYGIPDGPTAKPLAYHPGCFMKVLAISTAVEKKIESGGSYAVQMEPAPGAMRYALRSMGRTADEMRWRRRAKATCTTYHHSGEDPTKPEYHKWRCQCSTAPWNLTKQGRQQTREKHGVKK